MSPIDPVDRPRTGPAPSLRVRPLGDRTLIAELGTARPDGTFEPALVGPETSRITVGLAESARRWLGAAARDIVPSYRSVLVEVDPDRISFAQVERHLFRDLGRPRPASETAARTVTIPVAYGGEYGPDLDDVARHTGMTPESVIAGHSGGSDYRVAFLGFSPGYAYLLGLPPALATPRLATPRPRVPAGSVAIGGQQTGVYPQATPGGWRLIGRTAVPLFDVDRNPAALLRPGDRVVFRPVDSREFREISDQVRRGAYQPEIAWPPGEAPPLPLPIRSYAPAADRASLEVLRPGLLTTVQDAGRPGLGAQGISAGGALDRAAFTAANRLVGNPATAAVLEMSVTGPTLRPTRPVRLALTGADLGAEIDGDPAPFWEPFVVPAGSTLDFSPARASGTGVRGYLGVAGGIDVPLVIGSRSTDLTAGFGGLDGRALIAGDRLAIGSSHGDARSPVVVGPRPRALGSSVTLRVVLGPHDDLLPADALMRLLTEPYAVTSQSSHMGVRLSGPALPVADAGDLISEGIATGTVQVPADGQPIILLSGRGTVGGYAKVAGVIDADLDLAAQLRPGTMVRFRAVSLAEAHQAGRRYRALLDVLADDHEPSVAGASSGVGRVGEAARGLLASVRAMVPVPAGHGSGAWRSEPEDDLALTAPRGRPSSRRPPVGHVPTDTVVRAPLLGFFHRGGRPGGRPLVDVGDRLASGVTIGTITVLGLPNDVLTDGPAEIVAFLVEDGEPVEYGQPLARVRPLSPDDAGGDA